MRQTFGDLQTLPFVIDCMKRGDSLELPVCKPVLAIKMNHSGQSDDGQVVLGNVSNLVARVTVRNENQTAFGPIVKLLWRFVVDNTSASNETWTPPPVVQETSKLLRSCPSDTTGNPEVFDGKACQLVRQVLRNDMEVLRQVGQSVVHSLIVVFYMEL